MVEGKILVTGATGYIGGRIVPVLLENGFSIRVLARNPKRLQNKPWYDDIEVFDGDVLNKSSMVGLFEDVDTALYLIHSMASYDDFDSTDIKAAKNFSSIAKNEGLKRIIYLGGLADKNSNLSKHLSSRIETGDELRNSGINIIEFRASVIVGSGSLSFEMIRHLSERLPVMICPKWVYTKTQPIAIRNVLDYILKTIQLKLNKNYIFEIGGKDVLSYGDMIKEYSSERKLNRFLVPIPFLTPNLSSYWVHWTTPLSANITRPLVEGLKNESIIKKHIKEDFFKNIKLLNYKEAVSEALKCLETENVATSWSDSISSSKGRDGQELELQSKEGMIVESRKILINATAEKIYMFLCSIGGDKGWLYANFLWVIRGYIDLLLGGVGLRRGKRNQTKINQGDALDFWRVERIESNKLIRLKAEMKLPGVAWLEYKIDDNSNLIQTAYFAPKGLLGLTYWYSLYPIHKIIFRGLLNSIKLNVEKKK
ncbi:MAG: hypothetical protein CBD58_01520 [bacterium TMED198]|nr:MAG: hypothetical protein CBD58_01520 [bacterium TMED198]